MAEPNTEEKDEKGSTGQLSDAVKAEIEALTGAERAAVIMLLLGEQQAADIIRYLSPREVQNLGACMVAVADLSQEAVSAVLDDFVSTIKNQTNLGLGSLSSILGILKLIGQSI